MTRTIGLVLLTVAAALFGIGASIAVERGHVAVAMQLLCVALALTLFAIRVAIILHNDREPRP